MTYDCNDTIELMENEYVKMLSDRMKEIKQ